MGEFFIFAFVTQYFPTKKAQRSSAMRVFVPSEGGVGVGEQVPTPLVASRVPHPLAASAPGHRVGRGGLARLPRGLPVGRRRRRRVPGGRSAGGRRPRAAGHDPGAASAVTGDQRVRGPLHTPPPPPPGGGGDLHPKEGILQPAEVHRLPPPVL